MRWVLIAAALFVAACNRPDGHTSFASITDMPQATATVVQVALPPAQASLVPPSPQASTPNIKDPVPTGQYDAHEADPPFRPGDFAPPADPYAHPGVAVFRDGPGINAIPCRAFANGWDCHFINQQRALEAARAYGPPRRAWEHGFRPFQSTVPKRRPFKGFVAPDH